MASHQGAYIDSLPTTYIKKKTFWAELKSLLLNDTHFRDYLPLMNETEKQKVVRIYNDNSYLSNQAFEDYWDFLPKREPWDPSSNLYIVWIIIVCLINTYFLYQAGIVLTFGPTIWQDEMKFKLTLTLSWIFLGVYVADIFITLNTGYYMDGILILDRKRILSRYIKSLLIVDIPVIIIIFLCITIQVFGINYAKFYILTKLFTMNSLDYTIQRKLQIHRYLKAVYLIMRILWIVMWISNVMGLIFYVMDYYILMNGIYEPDFCWLVSSTAFNNIIDETWQVQYLYVIYWGVNTVTTISYGDIAPNNPIEVVYTLVCFVVAFVIYSYVLNQIVQTVLWAKQIRQTYRNQLVIINTFMRRKDVSQQLQQKTTEYLQFLYEEQSLRDQDLQKQMIAKLPEHLRLVLLKDAFKLFYLKLTQTFHNFPEQFISELLQQITETKLSNNQIIFEQNDDSNHSLYMLSKGNIHLTITYGKPYTKKYILKSITTSCQTFGELEFVTGGKRRYTAISNDVSALYYVQRDQMLGILKKSSKCNEYFTNMIEQIQISKKYYFIKYTCPQCQKNHLFEQCQQLFPQIKPTIIFKSSQSKGVPEQNIMRTTIRRRKSIHPQYRSKRQVANQIDKYAPKLQIEQIIRFKLQRRMALLQYHINTLKDKFEVDLYHDWEHYNPQTNPSDVFQIINKMDTSVNP